MSENAYRYILPIDAYRDSARLTGERVARAYWVHSDRKAEEATDDRAAQYGSSFRKLMAVVPGIHAFRLVFTDGTYEELSSYDTVCVAPRRCDTISCPNLATHRFSWPGCEGETVHEKVCKECGTGYMSRAQYRGTAELVPLNA